MQALEDITLAAISRAPVLRWLLGTEQLLSAPTDATAAQAHAVQLGCAPAPCAVQSKTRLPTEAGVGKEDIARENLGLGWASRLELRQMERPYWRKWLKRRAIRFATPCLFPLYLRKLLYP